MLTHVCNAPEMGACAGAGGILIYNRVGLFHPERHRGYTRIVLNGGEYGPSTEERVH